MERTYHQWWSDRLHRDMELLVFGHAGAKVLVFPTRGGRFFEYENLRMTEVLRDKIEAGHLQMFCLDSLDAESFYCWWAEPRGRIERHLQYESYILNEVFPLMELLNPHPCVISHGCSLGAFHAMNIALRHPHRFRKVAAFSGRYDLTMTVEHFGNLFDGYYDDDIYFNTPTHFMSGMADEPTLRRIRDLDIIYTIGKDDPFRGNNEYLSEIFTSKGVPHEFHLWDDRAHSGYYWRRMARIYL